MLVKVVLSYYMEGEHSQGVNLPRVSGLGAGGIWVAVLNGLRDGETGEHAVETSEVEPLTPRKR
jgi:hypothetical protein